MSVFETERRSFPRHRPVRNALWIGRKAPDRFRVARARLLDISVGGASLVIAESLPLPEGEWIWVRLADGEPSDWTEAEVVGTLEREGEGEGMRVRVCFASECPIGLFRAAVVGDADGDAALSDNPEGTAALPQEATTANS